MDETISLTSPEAETPKVSLTPVPGINVPQASTEDLQRRSAMMAFGMSEGTSESPLSGETALQSMTGQQYLDALVQGREGQLRKAAVVLEGNKLQEARLSVGKTMLEQATEERRPLSRAEQRTILDLTKEDFADAALDDRTVFERRYAQKVIDTAAALGEDNPFLQAAETRPDAAFFIARHFEDALARKEVFRRFAEDVQARADKQGWAGWGADLAKTLAPGFLWYKWNDANKVDVPGILPGSEKKELVKLIHSMSPEAGLTEAQRIIDNLNPSMAAEFAHALVDYTTSDEYLDNLLIAGTDVAVAALSLPIKALAQGTLKGAASLGEKTFQAAVKLGKAASSQTVPEAAKAAGESVRDSGRFLGRVVESLSRKGGGLEDAQDALGDSAGAALTAYFKQFSKPVVDGWEHVMRTVPSVFNAPEVVGTGGRWLAKNSVQNIGRILNHNADSLVKGLLLNPNKTDKLDMGLARAAAEEVRERVAATFRSPVQAILDVEVLDLERKIPGQTRFARVKLGDQDGELFRTKNAATLAAFTEYGMTDKSYTLFREANRKWGISFTTPVDETSPIYRNALKDYTTRNPTPIGNQIAQVLHRWRSADDTLPTDLVEAFNNIGYGLAGAKGVLSDLFAQLGAYKLDKNALKEFDDFTRMQQQRVSRIDPDKWGDASRTLEELELEWYARFQKPITEGQAALYLGSKQLNDFVWAASNIQQFMVRNREGFSNWNFKHGSLLRLENIEGKVVKDIPKDLDTNVGILVIQEDATGELENLVAFGRKEMGRRFNTDKPVDIPEPKNPKKPTKKELEAQVAAREHNENLIKGARSWNERLEDLKLQGYQIIQTSQYGGSKLAQTLEDSPAALSLALKNKPDVRFIVAKTSQKQMIDPVIIPHVDGFRFMPNPKSMYVRQPIVKENKGTNTIRYYGDRTLFQANDAKDGALLVEKLEQARRLLNQGVATKNYSAFKRFVKDEFPARMGRNLVSSFNKGAKGKADGIDPRAPFVVTRVNESSEKVIKLDDVLRKEWGGTHDFERNADITLGGYERNANMKATLERGDNVWRLNNVGSPTKPIWERQAPDLISARDSVEEMMGNFMRTQFNDDVKFQAAERFTAEFGDLLEPTIKAQLRDPIQMLLDDSVFKAGLQGEDAVRVKKAKVFQERARSFLGIMTDETKQNGFLLDKMLGDISEKFGQGHLKPLVEILEEYNKGRQAAHVLRSFAFHSKLGLFNPKQLFLQPMTIASMLGKVAPEALQPSAAALWHMGIVFDRNLTRLIPEVEKQLAKHGWKSGEFQEMYDLYRTSGYDAVRTSNIYLGDHTDFKVSRTAAGKFLFEDGLFFFNAGERMNRKASLAAAYKEWRLSNPTGKLNAKSSATILKRADLLNNNMAHQSRALWQEGGLSIPTQFMGYPIRMMEQLLGKRLTPSEKVRTLVAHGALFGVPISLSSATGVVPIHDIYRRAALESGYDTNSNIVASIFNEGLLGTLSGALAGEPTNFSDRFGPGATSSLWDAVFADERLAEFVSGPSGQTVAGLGAGIAPVIPWTWNFLQGDETLRPQALMDLLSEQVTTFGAIQKAYMGINTGGYYSKRSHKLIDDDWQAIQGVIEAALGTSPRRVSEVYDMQRIMRARSEVQSKLTPRMRDDIRAALAATNPEDSTTQLEMFKAKAIAGGFTERQISRMVSEETKGKTMREKTLKQFGNINPETNAFAAENLKKYEAAQKETN